LVQQVVNVGSAPNDGTGDTVRNGMIKINNNFTEIYTTYTMTGMVTVGNSTVNASVSNAVGYYFGNSTATFTANNSRIAITNFSVNSSLVNAAANVNISGLLNVAQYLFVNSTVLTVNGSANASSFTVGSDLVGNASGVYHTGVINAASHTVGSSLVGNSTGIYHTGTINSASHTVGSNFVANSTGAYHTGTVNAASHTVGTSTVANSTGVFTSGTANAAILQVGGKLVVNSSQFSFGSALPVEANGSTGTAGQYLTSDGSSKVYWSSPGVASVNTAGYFVWSNTHIFNKDIQANTVNAVSVTVGNVTVNSSIFKIPSTITLEANGSVGTSGQLLTSNGSTVYWSTVPGVNTNATYTWSNSATFNGNVVFAANVVTNTNLYTLGPVYISNITSFAANVLIENTASANIVGTAAFNNTATFNGNVSFTSNASFTKATYFSNTISVVGAAILSNTANVAGNLNVTGNSTFTGVVNCNGVSNFNANTIFKGTVSVAQANVLSQTLTDASTINWDTSSGQVATVTLGGNRAMAAPTNLKIGTYILHVIQDGTGNKSLTWNSVFKWTAGVAPVLTTDANARDIIMFISDGTNMYGSYLTDVK
jgi:hypothetical protein